ATTATPAVQCPVAPAAPAASSSIDTREISELNDALGSTGVDLWVCRLPSLVSHRSPHPGRGRDAPVHTRATALLPLF
ncbi:hypothetical protein C0993_000317, partial [Termitomyces sp. T159_Od127]